MPTDLYVSICLSHCLLLYILYVLQAILSTLRLSLYRQCRLAIRKPHYFVKYILILLSCEDQRGQFVVKKDGTCAPPPPLHPLLLSALPPHRIARTRACILMSGCCVDSPHSRAFLKHLKETLKRDFRLQGFEWVSFSSDHDFCLFFILIFSKIHEGIWTYNMIITGVIDEWRKIYFMCQRHWRETLGVRYKTFFL